MSYKIIFIVDPIRSDRIQMAKFLSEEVFTIMSFIAINDCFKRPDQIICDLIVFVPRKDKSEIKHLFHIKKNYRQIPIIILLNDDFPDINLVDLTDNSFASPYKASNNEKVREIMLGILASDGLPSRTEIPHPVPISEEVQAALTKRPK